MKSLFIILILSYHSIDSFGQRECSHKKHEKKPNWINSPDLWSSFIYIKGSASAKNRENKEESDFLASLKNQAEAEMAKSIQVDINVNTAVEIGNINGQSQEFIQQKSSSSSHISLKGLCIETYYDKKEKYGYAFAYTSRTTQIESNKAELKRHLQGLQDKITNIPIDADKEVILSQWLEILETFPNILKIKEVLIKLDHEGNIEKNDPEAKELFITTDKLFQQTKQTILSTQQSIEGEKKISSINTRKSKIENLFNAIQEKIKNAETNRDTDKNILIENYYQASFIYNDIQTLQTEIHAIDPYTLTHNKEIQTLFQNIEAKNKEVNNAITNITKNEFYDINSISTLIAYQIKAKTNISPGKEFLLKYFTLEDQRMTSAFSDKLFLHLKPKLSSINNLSILNLNVQTKLSPHYISGYYIEEHDKLVIFTSIHSENKVLATVETNISKQYLENNKLAYKPDNYQTAKKSSTELETGIENTGDLILDVSTNKGDDALLFKEGEKMTISVSANKKCFIRIIYEMADKTKVLLLDNFEYDKMGDWYKIPYDFVCATPFGTETMLVFAKAEKFYPLNTTHQDGYEFITDGLDIKEIQKQVRGFKKTNQDYFETFISVTTIKQ
ncbi:MAG: hypothetical protein QM536_02805 [Chitinophagaceae bacterium]|nr:hypothetical protein [Chitinophagaceae bacterium]